MKITRIILIKESFRKEAEDVNSFIADLEADAENAGYIVTGTNARIDLNTSRCHVEVEAERRGKLEKVSVKKLCGAQERVKSVDLKVSTEDECNQPLYLAQ